jgi:hypothetical protein
MLAGQRGISRVGSWISSIWRRRKIVIQRCITNNVVLSPVDCDIGEKAASSPVDCGDDPLLEKFNKRSFLGTFGFRFSVGAISSVD